MERLPKRTAGLVSILAGLLAIGVFWAVGLQELDGYRLGVGLVGLPRAPLVYFIAFWTFLGGAGLLGTAIGVASLADTLGWDRRSLLQRLDAPSYRTVVWVGVAFAALSPLLIRLYVLQGAPVTDDESAYRFMAQLIATGRVTVESPPVPLKLFFDRFQMVNDGSRFAQYFVGWPALMAPGVWLGVGDWMNVVYAAAAVPPLAAVADRLGGRWTAVAAVLLYVTSPFLMVGAATLGSHTSCVAAIAWTYWAFFQTRDQDAGPLAHALFAITFSIAFFIRPLAAAGLGLPLLFSWSWARLRRDATWQWSAILSFAAPAACLAALFLAVNYAQTGSPFTVAYQAFLEYAQQNGGRFTGTPQGGESGIPNLAITGLTRGASLVGIGLLRFDVALFGWPISMIFVLFAGFDRETRTLWASALGFLVSRLLLRDPGIDLFGPVHFTELALPVLLLSAAGIHRATELLSKIEVPDERFPLASRSLWPAAGLVTAVVLSALCYLPVRFGVLQRVAANTRLPEAAVRHNELGEAVVFAPRPFVPSCLGEQTRHFVFWRHLNPPDLRSDLLWVNHVTVEDDRTFMRYAPDRSGYILAWGEECTPHLVPLQSDRAESVPPGHIGGTGEGPDWSRAPDPDDYRIPAPR